MIFCLIVERYYVCHGHEVVAIFANKAAMSIGKIYVILCILFIILFVFLLVVYAKDNAGLKETSVVICSGTIRVITMILALRGLDKYPSKHKTFV